MELQGMLLNWFLHNQRILPFRGIDDPYRIWVSEVMLQQTQVDTVIPYYDRFMKRFPTVFDLAKASEDDIFKLWEGLGYYSRARNLLKCAKEVVLIHDGIFPKGYKEIIKLPGIGPYTAGAILSIAYNLKYPAVDGNVMRVISRLFNIREDIAISKNRKVFEEKVKEILPEDVRNFNPALMELGALICTPKNPKCDKCPLATCCIANELHIQDELPIKTKKMKNKKYKVSVGIVKDNGKVLLIKNEKGLLSGLWGFPLVESNNKNEALTELLNKLKTQYGFDIQSVTEIKEEKHVFTHKTWHMTAYEIILDSEQYDANRVKEASSEYSVKKIWIREEAYNDYAISTAMKKFINC